MPNQKGKTPGFWGWYERHYGLNLTLTTLLFLLQIGHLYWLFADVISSRLFGQGFFSPSPFWQYIIILVDYTEVPALVTTTILYIYELQKRFSWKNVLYIIFLNSQWLHLFWITDEFVINTFSGREATVLPAWLAWVAIIIDYLELPVIIDTIAKTIRMIRKGGLRSIVTASK